MSFEFVTFNGNGGDLTVVGYNYLSSSNIRRSIVYGDQPRNRYYKCLIFHLFKEGCALSQFGIVAELLY